MKIYLKKKKRKWNHVSLYQNIHYMLVTHKLKHFEPCWDRLSPIMDWKHCDEGHERNFHQDKLLLNQDGAGKQETHCSNEPISSQGLLLGNKQLTSSRLYLDPDSSSARHSVCQSKSLQPDSWTSSNKQSVLAQSLQLRGVRVHGFTERYRRHAAGNKAGVVKFM